MDSGEEYVIKRRQQIKQRRKLLIIVSLVSFIGSMVFSALPAIKQAIEAPNIVLASPESSLQNQAQGFEMVLQREPENQVALEGLANVRLQLKDTQGAIPPLEKLVKLHPEHQEYKVILERLKKEQPKSDDKSTN